MRTLVEADILKLRQSVEQGIQLRNAIALLGSGNMAGGIWRLYSDYYPKDGVTAWNIDSMWKSEWKNSTKDLNALGEDVFGNQLCFLRMKENVFLWNHENGETIDLGVDPITMFEAIFKCGLKWIDFYDNGCISVAEKRIADLPLQCHLHWTTPLILGGAVSLENTSIVERGAHLVGHAKLWGQIEDLPPGTIVIR